jgi:hypothetical protein
MLEISIVIDALNFIASIGAPELLYNPIRFGR